MECDTHWLPGHSCDEQRPTAPPQIGEAAPDNEAAESERYLTTGAIVVRDVRYIPKKLEDAITSPVSLVQW